jgi:hypothetical protein
VSGSSARKAVVRELLTAAEERFDRVSHARPDRWALRYLEASRPTSVVAAAPLSAADLAKLASAQADQIVGVIRAVLEGLNLSDADYTRGLDLAIKELRVTSGQRWEPL